MRSLEIKIITIALMLAVVPYVFAAAQESVEEELDADLLVAGEMTPMPPNTVSCFDYYSFGSVQANVSPSVAGTVSGAPITFSGSLENNNAYPIVDGALFVKIFKSRGDTNDGNGPDVVDQFLVKGDIAIPANGSVPVNFQWKVPTYAQSGEYSVATFFTTSRKFNLLGLSFTDDVVGNTASFTVNGEQSGIVKFDKTAVTINNDPYYFAAFPPRVEGTAPAVVDARIRNTNDTPQKALVSWVVYQWDGQLRENVVQEETRQITVPANGTADASITVNDTKYPVYLAVATLTWNDTKSVIGARFVRSGVDRTRINFPGVTAFPLVAGSENTLFSCLHNSGESESVPGGRLELTLSDLSGNLIHEYTYSGDVTGAMMGVAEKFIPEKNYDYFVLDARLYQGEEFLDEAHLVYDCNVIDPNLCAEEQPINPFSGFQDMIIFVASGIGALVFIVVALWIYKRVSRRPVSSQLPPM